MVSPPRTPTAVSPRPAKNGLWPLIGVLSLLGFFGLCVLLVAGSAATSVVPAVGLIELSGAITDEGARGVLGGGPSGGARDFIADVEAARRDETLKAIVIRVNSPGGSASASQEMFQAVQRLRAEKPVICSMGDIAASGGYYVAASCDKIYANGSTLTGSIGVISQFLNYGELFKKLGLDEATIKSGKFKDAGSPTRPLTPAERALFQAMINDVYQQFISDVVAGRKAPTNGKLTRQKLLQIADGRVFTGRQAKNLGLVDANGGLYEAVQDAATRGGLPGTPIVRKVGGGGGLGSLLSAQSEGNLGASLEKIGNQAAYRMGGAFAAGAASQLKSEIQTSPHMLAK